jgi:sulfur relay protein TusC/DsrF
MKRIVILSTNPPYGSSINAEGFRAGLGLAFSEFVVDIILVHDGVYALLKDQSPQELGMKSLGEVYANITQFKINLFADEESLRTRGLVKKEIINAKPLSTDEIKAVINAADAVLTF